MSDPESHQNVVGKEDEDEDEDEDWKQCPLFMTKLPEKPEEHEGLAALQSILYDDMTADERAENYNQQANEYFKAGKRKYRNAFVFYTKAIVEPDVLNTTRRSVYYSNRAQVQLKLENFGKAIEDCESAISLHPKNSKAYWRAAQACKSLSKPIKGIEFCEKGLEEIPDCKPLLQMRDTLEQMHKQMVQEEEAKAKQREEQQTYTQKKTQQTLEFLSQRGMQLGARLVQTSGQYEACSFSIDEDHVIHWPVLLCYPEYRQSDFIQDFNETHTFLDHLNIMFPEDAPSLPWDEEKKYKCSALEVYYETYQTQPLKKKHQPLRKTKVRVSVNHSLREVLSRDDYIIPGFPIFYVVVFASEFQDRWLRES